MADGAPAGGDSGSGTPGGDAQGSLLPGSTETTSSQPVAPAAPPDSAASEASAASEGGDGTEEGERKAPGPGWVPWAEHRQIKSELARQRREAAQLQQRYQTEVSTLQQQREQVAADIRRKADDYEALQAALVEHPDIADQLYDRLGTPAERRPGRDSGAIPPAIAEKLEKLDRIDAAIAKVEQREVETQKQMRLQETERELDGGIGKILSDRRYKNADRLLPLCKDYVLERVRQMEDATMDDVPHLLAEYLLPWEQEFQARLEGYRQGKTDDLRLPVSAGGGTQNPLGTKTALGANDDQTSRIAEELIASRLGWGNGAAQ